MTVSTKSEHGWAFYTPIAYFIFFFLQPILDHAGWKEWLLTGLGTVIFLVLYFEESRGYMKNIAREVMLLQLSDEPQDEDEDENENKDVVEVEAIGEPHSVEKRCNTCDAKRVEEI